MTDAEQSRRIPIDEAAFEAWLSETINFPTDVPRPLLDSQSEAILALVNHVREALVPVEPSPNFVRELGQSLTRMASQQHQSFPQRYGRALVFGMAAAGSVISVVSVGAYLYYRREQRHSRIL